MPITLHNLVQTGASNLQGHMHYYTYVGVGVSYTNLKCGTVCVVHIPGYSFTAEWTGVVVFYVVRSQHYSFQW